MRVIIVGRSGQLARCLAEARPREAEAVFLGRDRLDLARFDTGASGALAEARPDLVINAAAYTAVDRAESEPEAAFAVNRDGAAALACFCAARDIPLIHVSTDYVFNGEKPCAYREDDEPSPLNVYGASKLAGEQFVRGLARRFLIVRASWVYSAHGQNFVRTMLRLAGERDRLRVVDHQRGCPTSAHDLARALWRAAGVVSQWAEDSPRWGVYHYAGEGAVSWAGFAEAIFAGAAPHLARVPAVERIGSNEYPTPAARPGNSVLDCSKFQHAFDLAPRPWRQGLAEVLAQLIAQSFERNADEGHHSGGR